MSENYIRWYDKDPDLSHLMAFIENLPDNIREEIAQDLIQIISNELKINNDTELFELGKNSLAKYRRWYDYNITLHSAIEIIKNLNTEKRTEIIHSIMESIVQILAGHNNE